MALYSDALLCIERDEIEFAHYYFPTGRSKTVQIADIESIEVKRPGLWTGKWRLQGTGDFKTWFALDAVRPQRDRIFVAKLRSQWFDVGFTAEDGEPVEQLLREMGLV